MSGEVTENLANYWRSMLAEPEKVFVRSPTRKWWQFWRPRYVWVDKDWYADWRHFAGDKW